MARYSSYITISKKNYEKGSTEYDHFENCCFIIGFTSVVLSVSFIIGYLVYNYN